MERIRTREKEIDLTNGLTFKRYVKIKTNGIKW